MIVKPETPQDIVLIIAAEFPSFGGGKTSKSNPISMALEDKPAQFALGVPIADVVNRVLELQKMIK